MQHPGPAAGLVLMWGHALTVLGASSNHLQLLLVS
jgi:hypothetical protein